MTIEELAEIRRDLEYALSGKADHYDATGAVGLVMREHVLALLAEVERLRALVEAHHSIAFRRLLPSMRCPICAKLEAQP